MESLHEEMEKRMELAELFLRDPIIFNTRQMLPGESFDSAHE